MKPHKKDLKRYIYALIDPRNNAVRYVGCAGDIEKRLQEHVRSKNLAAPKYQWLAELKQSGLSPKLEILETVEGYSPTFAREEYWIKKLIRSGEPLNECLAHKGDPVRTKEKSSKTKSR